ncbi:MAG: hypothetical protein ACM3N6_15725 [Betaproteobacteria bacterium]
MDDALGVVYWMRQFNVPRKVLRHAVERAHGDVAAVARLLGDWHRALPMLDRPAMRGQPTGGYPFEREHWAGGPPQRFLLCCRPNRIDGHRFKAHVVIRDASGRVIMYMNPPSAPFSSSWEAADYSHEVARRWLAEHG